MTPLVLAGAVLAAAASAPSPSPAPPKSRYDPAGLVAIDAMRDAGAAIKDYTMRLVKRELIGRELEDEEQYLVKWDRHPRIYMKEVAGVREGQEVLWSQGWNKGKIKVHKGSFPDVNLSLDPYGTLAMAHAHHPVPEISLVRFIDLVVANVARARGKGVGTLEVEGQETLFGRTAVKLEIKVPPTGKTPTLERGQTLWDVARATGQSMYVILHANRARGWSRPDDPLPGDAMIVPDYYANRLVLWVDVETHLPLQADLYDQDGALYEHYEHRDLQVNVGLTDADFNPKNPAYRF